MTTHELVDDLDAQLLALGHSRLDAEQIEILSDGPIDERRALLDDLDARVGVRPCSLDDVPAAEQLTAAFGRPFPFMDDRNVRCWSTGQDGFHIVDTLENSFQILQRVETAESVFWLHASAPTPAWDVAWLIAYWSPVLSS